MARRVSHSEQAMYVISVAAELAGVHPQTLRVYERKGLVQPQRTAGNTRRYSPRDIVLLRRIQELTGEGINLAGVMKVLALEEEIERVKILRQRALEELEQVEQQMRELLEAREGMAMVPLKDVRRVRRAMKADDVDAAGRRRVFFAPPISEG